jgi:hypothetical protein
MAAELHFIMRRPVIWRALVCCIIHAAMLAARGHGEVVVYPVPSGIAPSLDYELRADGKSVFVHACPAFSFASFSLEGKAQMVVHVNRPIKRAVVRPLALGITAFVDQAGVLSFTLEHPCNIAIEVDDDLRRPLFVFANAPETHPPSAGGRGVRYFSGGRIHDVGRLELQSNETLSLAGGAIVRGEVHAAGASGLRFCGPGVLDATARTRQGRLIRLDGCKDVELRDLIVLGSLGWSVDVHRCEDVLASNLKVISWRDNDDGFDPDSSRRVRVEGCFFRTKDDCIAVKAHGPRDGSAGSASGAFNTEDITVTRSTFWSSEWGHALTVGFAVSAPAIRNVVFRDCDIIKKERGPAMSIDNHDLGRVENVRFEDIRIEEGCDRLTALKTAFSEYSADCPYEYFRNNPKRLSPEGDEWQRILQAMKLTRRGSIQGVTFKNIQVLGDRVPESIIRGFNAESKVTGVLFQNVTLNGRELKTPGELHLHVQNAEAVKVE